MTVTYLAHLIDRDGFEKTMQVHESIFKSQIIHMVVRPVMSASYEENDITALPQRKTFWMDTKTLECTTVEKRGETTKTYRADFTQ